MKITDLAALVQVRNHVLTVINDKSVTNRDDFKPLNEVRIKLDKKFVEVVKTLDVDSIFPNELLIVTVGRNPTNEELENWRDIFESSLNDPNFKIFTNDPISIIQLSIDSKSEVRVEPGKEEHPDTNTKFREMASVVANSIASEMRAPASPIQIRNEGERFYTVNGSNSNIAQKRQLNLPFQIQEKPVDPVLSVEVDTLTDIANGEIRKLEEQNVTISPAVVAEVAKPIQVPEEAKLAVVEKARKTKLTEASQDPDIAAAIARQKKELKIQGRSNEKVKKDD